MELNGNYAVIGESNEDLSEYTDADESMSAPTEILAEFLSSVMKKDYVNALKYCKIILEYEPNHATAKEFYPLILQKIKIEGEDRGDSSEASGSCSDDESSSLDSSHDDNGSDENGNTDSDGTTASYSSLEDEVADHRPSTSAQQDDNAFSRRNNGNLTLYSDSESPTEPVTQQLVKKLRSSVLPIKI